MQWNTIVILLWKLLKSKQECAIKLSLCVDFNQTTVSPCIVASGNHSEQTFGMREWRRKYVTKHRQRLKRLQFCFPQQFLFFNMNMMLYVHQSWIMSWLTWRYRQSQLWAS